MEKRKITKSMQEVLESPEFIKTQTQIVDIMQKYRLFATQLNEAFEKIRVPMQALNTALLNEASPLHNLSQNFSVTLSQISEFINSYEEADTKLKDIEQEITPVINTNWDSSQMVESVVIQVKVWRKQSREIAVVPHNHNLASLLNRVICRIWNFV